MLRNLHIESLKSLLTGLGPEGREALAARLGISGVYLYQIAARQDGRKPSPELAVRIERETGGAVTRQELRPDDYLDIWPELAAQEA